MGFRRLGFSDSGKKSAKSRKIPSNLLITKPRWVKPQSLNFRLSQGRSTQRASPVTSFLKSGCFGLTSGGAAGTHTVCAVSGGPSRASGGLPGAFLLGPNKRGCNKRRCKSRNRGKQNWQHLFNICRSCATLTKFVGNTSGCKSVVLIKVAQHLPEVYGPLCYGTLCSCQTLGLLSQGLSAGLPGSFSGPSRGGGVENSVKFRKKTQNSAKFR